MDYNPFSLSSKTILVTGASSGIGRATAIECSRMGALLLITGRNETRLSETFGRLHGSGHRMVTADLGIDSDISDLVNQAGPLDGLVHSAGFTKMMPVHFLKRELLDDIMDLNFKAPVVLTQRLLESKKIKKGASVVFLSSMNGTDCAIAGQGAYAASKAAINGIVKIMALELASKGIRVNSVSPGMVSTGILNDGSVTEEQIQEDIKKYPLKRYGKPEEIAHSVIYLLSGASSWVTGSSLLIDGGYTLQ